MLNERCHMWFVLTVQGYRCRKAYIATQGPMMETTEDFWRMLWEHNCSIVVMMTKVKEMGVVSLPFFSYIFIDIVGLTVLLC